MSSLVRTCTTSIRELFAGKPSISAARHEPLHLRRPTTQFTRLAESSICSSRSQASAEAAVVIESRTNDADAKPAPKQFIATLISRFAPPRKYTVAVRNAASKKIRREPFAGSRRVFVEAKLLRD
jgi:hypothetical protein